MDPCAVRPFSRAVRAGGGFADRTDFNDADNPDFVINPGNGEVTHNIMISKDGTIGDVSDNAYKYSKIEDNAVFRLSELETIFVDPKNGDYTLRGDAPIDFDIDVPAMSEFGRRTPDQVKP